MHHAKPYIFIIVGATGDLAKRKLLPAYYRLTTEGNLGRGRVLGVARQELNDEQYREQMREALLNAGIGDDVKAWCASELAYQPLTSSTPVAYEALKARIEEIELEADLPANRVFYLAIPPDAFDDTINGLGEAGLNKSDGWTRLVIEKPFGYDLESAKQLNAIVHKYFDESQIYRIDHYLGKETVQNLLAFRFANPIFEHSWNRDRVERVEIIVSEKLGVEGRAGYYEGAGALRDMIQNHLTQLMTLVAMEVPARFDADSIRNEKIKVLHSVEPIETHDVIYGQYTEGTIDDEHVIGYRQEDGVRSNSATETFAAVKLSLASWRWQGVPFILRTGKRLRRGISQIAVVFRKPPVRLFASRQFEEVHPNVLLITIQPDESFSLGFDVKVPGEGYELRKTHLHFRYDEEFGRLPEAYETLLLDIIVGDQTLFVHAEEAEKSWEIYTPLLERRVPVKPYPAGSWGPVSADELLNLDESDYMLPAIIGDEIVSRDEADELDQ
ncbi:MAG: glucose-6-phosphate dehydrogenase [bacterium]|nr:glucose-6-phosphate dehydrogenase [Candidatus Kapabacteria bacterium]